MTNYLLKKSVLLFALLFMFANNSFAEQKEKSIILGDYSVKNPKDIIERAYKDAKWEDLSIEFCLVSPEPKEGFVPMKLNNPVMKENVYYVAPQVDFNLKDISAMDVFYRPMMAEAGSLGVNIYFKKEAFARFQDYSNKHIREFVGIIVNGRLTSAIKIMEPLERNRLGIGEFSVNEAIDIVNKFFKPLKSIWQYLS